MSAPADGRRLAVAVARIFISYRSSDGADKATALARDLVELFGDEQIFLDKEDLAAGSHWRKAIASAVGASPVLLVLVTPNFLGARDGEGRLCIERADDPTRAELEAGLAANATVMPLLCDGVAAAPSAEGLPPPFDRLVELHWGRLRAFDWRNDLARLAADLEALGVVRRAPGVAREAGADHAHGGSGSGSSSRRTVVAALGGAAAVALAAGSVFAWRWYANRDALSGTWRARVGRRGAATARDGEPLVVTFEQRGKELSFVSSAVEISRLPEWSEYRAFWRERFGSDLDRVFYRGIGTVRTDTELPASGGTSPVPVRRIALAVSVVPPGGADPINSGALEGVVDADDRIHARLWLNDEQAERVVELRRADR